MTYFCFRKWKYYKMFFNELFSDFLWMESQEIAYTHLDKVRKCLSSDEIVVFLDSEETNDCFGYTKQLYEFKFFFLQGDYIECCRQLEELADRVTFTLAIKNNLLYLFHETLEKYISKDEPRDF